MQDEELNPSDVPREATEEGRSVDDAVQKAMERLGVTAREDVEVEVLEEGSKGVFNIIGGKQARVLVRLKAQPQADVDEVSAKIGEMVGDLMRIMGIGCQVAVKVEDGIHRVSVETAGVDGLLIGKKGQTLDDLGHLLRRMVGKQLRKSVRMDVDVGGYKMRRAQLLRNKALSLASRAKASGKDMQMEPLSAAERRVVHLAVAADQDIKTYTVGEGDLKSVVIAPARRSNRGASREETRVGL